LFLHSFVLRTSCKMKVAFDILLAFGIVSNEQTNTSNWNETAFHWSRLQCKAAIPTSTQPSVTTM